MSLQPRQEPVFSKLRQASSAAASHHEELRRPPCRGASKSSRYWQIATQGTGRPCSRARSRAPSGQVRGSAAARAALPRALGLERRDWVSDSASVLSARSRASSASAEWLSSMRADRRPYKARSIPPRSVRALWCGLASWSRSTANRVRSAMAAAWPRAPRGINACR